MKFKVVVICAAVLLVVLTLGTGVVFGSNRHFLREDATVSIPDANLYP